MLDEVCRGDSYAFDFHAFPAGTGDKRSGYARARFGQYSVDSDLFHLSVIDEHSGHCPVLWRLGAPEECIECHYANPLHRRRGQHLMDSLRV